MKTHLLTITAILLALGSFAQETEERPDYRITIGLNVRRPLRSVSTFPLLLIEKQDNNKKKLIFGGVTIGVSRFFPVRQTKFNLKTTVNFSRQMFWDKPTQLNKGPAQQDMLGQYTSYTKEYFAETSGIVHYVPRKRFSVGLGVGFQFLLASSRRFPPGIIAEDNPEWLRNRQYKTVMPVIPFEISFKDKRMLYNFHWDLGLLNRYRNDLPDYDKNVYLLFAFEVGMRI